MLSIPENFYRYKQMPVWNLQTIAPWVLGVHNTKVWVYGKINIIRWELEYTLYDEDEKATGEALVLSPSNPWIAFPQQNHSVKPLTEDMEMYIDFYKQKPEELWGKEQAFREKYDKKPHFEVIQLEWEIWKWEIQTVLDLWCGWGRNGIFFAEHGTSVTSVDKNIEALKQIEKLSEGHSLDIKTQEVDLYSYTIDGNFDAIISTVVLQFFKKETSLRIVKEMQEHTSTNGYNLIITPIESEDVPCILDFPCFFEKKELKELYKDWEIIEYNEMIWELHRKDENGNKIRSRFATLIAQKREKI